MHNNFIYCVIGIDQEAECLTKGFSKFSHSKDGLFILGDKSDTDMCPWVDLCEFPQWMLDLVPSLSTSCCLSHEQAELIYRSPNWFVDGDI